MSVLPFLTGMLLTASNGSEVDDTFSRIRDMMANVNPLNCSLGARVELPRNTVSHVPQYVRDPSQVQPSNRTSLQYAYNVAASRAMFLSLIYKLTEASSEWQQQPGMQYLYLSTAANVQAGPRGVSSSGLFFGENKTYVNWIPSYAFNNTLPLFGVRASFVDGVGNLVRVKDLGYTAETNYTNRAIYPQDYLKLLRDQDSNEAFARRTMAMRVHYTHNESRVVNFNLRKMAGQGIAQLITPYYDCHQTNKWLTSFGANAGEQLARYTYWKHLTRFRNVALSSVDVEFESVDINVCPMSRGNLYPNAFSGSAHCPPMSQGVPQECRPTHGSGFDRFGYVCCRSDDCPQGNPVTPAFRDAASREMNGHGSIIYCSDLRPTSNAILSYRFSSMDDLKVKFEVQGREGLRLALFLSAFLQINNPDQKSDNRAYWEQFYRNYDWSGPPVEADSPLRFVDGDHELTIKQLFAEVYSTLMTDGALSSVGIYLESGYVFGKTDPVGAFAWREATADVDGVTGLELGANVADLYEVGHDFTQLEWFSQARSRYSFLTPSDLTEYKVMEEVRYRHHFNGNKTVEELPAPFSYYAMDYDQGWWFVPHWPCNGIVSGWRVSFLSPIFGKTDTGDLHFAGVVKVDPKFTINHIHETSGNQ